MIHEMSLEHVDRVASLHFENFNDAFLCELGIPFLKVLYSNIVTSPFNFGYVFIKDSSIIGFITGTLNSDKFLKNLAQKKFRRLVLPLGSVVIKKPIIIKRILQTLIYPNKANCSENAELFSIAVDKKYRNKLVATRLFEKLRKHLKEKGIKRFKVIVEKENISAVRFYKRKGFNFIRTFEIYDKKMDLYNFLIK